MLSHWKNSEKLTIEWVSAKFRNSSDNPCFKIHPSTVIIGLGKESSLTEWDPTSDREHFITSFKKLAEISGSTNSVPFIWMLQDSVHELLLPEHYRRVTNQAVDAYNKLALDVLTNDFNLIVVDVNRLIAQQFSAPAYPFYCMNPGCETTLPEAFQVSDKALYETVQLLWNFHCNEAVRMEAATCCRTVPPMSTVQARTFLLIGLCFITTAICFLLKTFKRSDPRRVILQKADTLRKNAEVDRDGEIVESDSTQTKLFIDGSDRSLAVEKQYEFLLLLSKFGALLIFFFLCDRTRLFSVVNKSFSWITFWIPLLAVAVIGFIFTGKTNQTMINHVDITREWKGWMQLYFLIYHFAGGYSVLPPFMWARICVSSYLFLSGFGHFAYFSRQSIGNSSNSAFRSSSSDHNEFSFVQSWWSILKRYLDVMFRMNFFVVALCFVMDVDYLFYYFMPLISFWFTVIVIMMTVGSCKSASTDLTIPAELPITASDKMPSQPLSIIRKTQFFNPRIVMLFKFAVLIGLIEIVYRVRPLFHFIFYSWFIRKIFKLDKPEPNVFKAAENTDVLAEQFWFYRWSLDRYTTVWGMLFAFCCEWLRHVNLMDDSTCGDLILFNRKSPLIRAAECHQPSAESVLKPLSRVSCPSPVRQNFSEMFRKTSVQYFIRLFPVCATIFGLGGLILTIISTTVLRSRQFGMELHAYLCIFPIVSYILVRNSFGFLRARYSIFFAWFGDISLELFIGQYHIWLANNTHGVLALLPNCRMLNLILTTLIFVCVCHEVHQLTNRLHTYVLPKTPQTLLCRSFVLCFLLFFLTFIP